VEGHVAGSERSGTVMSSGGGGVKPQMHRMHDVVASTLRGRALNPAEATMKT